MHPALPVKSNVVFAEKAIAEAANTSAKIQTKCIIFGFVKPKIVKAFNPVKHQSDRVWQMQQGKD